MIHKKGVKIVCYAQLMCKKYIYGKYHYIALKLTDLSYEF